MKLFDKPRDLSHIKKMAILHKGPETVRVGIIFTLFFW